MSTFCESPNATRTDWETPQWLFDSLNAEFHFTLDVCASSDNAKCALFNSEENPYRAKWVGHICWMNPPYGKDVGAWVSQAHGAAILGATVVCLLPARSNCAWWRYVIEGEVRFIRKKLRFVGGSSVSMFPNVIVVFRPSLAGGGRMSILEPPHG
jgi:phage N-6-adenine-methyltransferase